MTSGRSARKPRRTVTQMGNNAVAAVESISEPPTAGIYPCAKVTSASGATMVDVR